jgi:hypothetical protein
MSKSPPVEQTEQLDEESIRQLEEKLGTISIPRLRKRDEVVDNQEDDDHGQDTPPRRAG